MPSRGRRPGSPDTARSILDAARDVFGRSGFDKATIRSIAEVAKVDAALVLHYFGSKDELFAAALDIPVDPAELDTALAGDRDGIGERVTRFYLGMWESPATGPPLRGVLRASTTHAPAAAMLRQFITTQILARVAGQIAADRPELRATLAGSQLIGVVMARYIIAVPPLAHEPLEHVVQVVAPHVQQYLTGPLPPS